MHLADKPKQFLKIIKLKTVDSTNNYAFNLAIGGAREITIVYADSQTNGKGSRNNQWISPNGGLYLSFLLRPGNLLQDISSFPLYFALGAINGLDKIIETKIKPPNDLMVGNKKIGGVLVESRTTADTIDFLIVGIGININSKKNQLPNLATSLYIETGTTHDIEPIFKDITQTTLALYTEIKTGNIGTLNKKIAQLKWENKKLT